MGISIKNEQIEDRLRAYAQRMGYTLTRALDAAIDAAEREEATARSRQDSDELWQGFLEAARKSTYRSDRPWTREELHER